MPPASATAHVPAALATAPAKASAATPKGAAASRRRRLGPRFFKWEIVVGIVWGLASVYLSRGDPIAFASGFGVGFSYILTMHVIIRVITFPFRRIGPLVFLAGLLAFAVGSYVAAAYYVAAPDLPNGALGVAQSWAQDAIGALPFNAPDGPVRRDINLTPVPLPSASPTATQLQEAKIRAALETAGVQARSVAIVTDEAGQKVLAVGLSSSTIVSSGASTLYDALLRIGQSKTLDLTGLAHVMTAVSDDQGRVLAALAVPVSAIERFRGGQISRRDFIASAALRVVSRAGIIDAARSLGK